MNYWEECIREAFEDLKVKATEDQINGVVTWVEGAHENYGLATGNDVADANWESEDTINLRELKKTQERHEAWVNSTKPCRLCTTTGVIRDGWGRDCTCHHCNGQGRVKPLAY